MSTEAGDESRNSRRLPPEESDREHGQGRDHDREVTILVNGKTVKLSESKVTGAEIKKAAIAQGVQIKPNFILHRELPNGGEEIVGDRDQITVRPKDRFTALEPDDNS